jgi:iron complex outermembrane recepter protein
MASAQRSAENALASADDAFGVDIGNEQVGLYSSDQVRGFSPATAGNIRIDGLSAQIEGLVTDRIFSGNTIHVGITAQQYPFPAPTGIADFTLRSAGGKTLLSSIATLGPVNNEQIEMDGQLPIAGDSLGLAAGASWHRVGGFAGLSGDFVAVGGVLHWQPSAKLSIKPFMAFIDGRRNRSALPLYFPQGAFAPPLIPRRYHPLPWAAGQERTLIAGAVLSFRPSDAVKIEGGIFRWSDRKRSAFQDLYSGVQSNGTAERFLVASHDLDSVSLSGEARATLRLTAGRFAQSLLLDVKGRDTARTYGQVDVLDLGSTSIFSPAPVPKQELIFGEPTNDRIRQLTIGGSYQASLMDRLRLAVSLQKSFYNKSTLAPGAPAPIISVQKPLLYGASLLARASHNLTLYGGYTRGLEEAASAPAAAMNRFAPVPAILTSQRDAGARLRFGRFTLIAGIFDVDKPFIGLDAERFYRLMGQERHRGIEASLTGNVSKQLRIIAGALVMKADVQGEAIADHLIGDRPPGIPDRLLEIDAEWQPSRELSVRISLQSQGSVAASTQVYAALGGRQLSAPGRDTLGLSVRHGFTLAGSPASIKLEADNIFDAHAWSVGPDASFSFSPQRRVWASIAADF